MSSAEHMPHWDALHGGMSSLWRIWGCHSQFSQNCWLGMTGEQSGSRGKIDNLSYTFMSKNPEKCNATLFHLTWCIVRIDFYHTRRNFPNLMRRNKQTMWMSIHSLERIRVMVIILLKQTVCFDDNFTFAHLFSVQMCYSYPKQVIDRVEIFLFFFWR